MALRTRQNNAVASLQVTTAWSPVLSSTGAFLTTDQLYWNGVTGTNATVTMGGLINVGGTGGGILLGSGQTVGNPVVLNGSNITLGTNGVDLTSTSADLTIGPSVFIDLNANQNWKAGARTITASGTVRGAFKITISNSGGNNGVVSFLSANTYSGGTDISSGFVRVGTNTTGAVTNGPLGTGTVTMTGGALSSDSTTAYTLANALSLNGTMTLGDATKTGDLTFSGTTSIAGATALTTASTVTLSGQLTGTGTLTKAGSGDLVLTGASNSNSGAFTASGGTTWVLKAPTGTPSQLSSAASVTINSGAAVVFTGGTATAFAKNISGVGSLFGGNTGLTIQSPASLSGFTGTFYQYSSDYDSVTNANTKTAFSDAATFPVNAGLIGYRQNSTSPTMTIAYTGSGNVTTTGNWNFFNFTGGTGAWTAVLQHYGTSGATFTIGGTSKTISADGSYNLTWQLDVSSTGALNVNNNIVQPAGSGALSLQKIGTGPVVLAGANTFTGTVSVTTGTLNANSATALGAASSTAAISVTSGATLSLGGASNVTYSSRTVALAGTGVSNAGALVVANAVTNTFSGITLTAGTLIRGTESGTLTAPITTGDFVLTFTVADTKTLTFPSVIGASGTTVATNTLSGDTGTLVLSAQSLYTGPTTVNRGTVRVGASSVGSPGSVTSGPLGRGQITWNGGALDASTTATLGNNVALGGNVSFGGTAALTLAGTVSLDTSRTITTNGSGGALTLSGVVSGTGYKLTKAGTNTLKLTNTNTYSGGTDILGGEIEFSNGALGSIGSISIPGATLVWAAGNTQDISSRVTLTNGYTAILDVGANNVTFASSFGGSTSGAVAKYGSGTLLLLGTNSYTGGTSIQNGTVSFANGGLGSSGPITFGVGTLRWNTGNTQDISSRLGVLGSAVFDTNGNNVIFSSAIGGSASGSLTKAGAGTLRLNGTNTYFGATTVSAGTLQLVGTIYSFSTITNNSSLSFDSASSQTIDGTISGTGSISKSDYGTLTLKAQNTYQGNTTLLAGTTQAGNTQAFGTVGSVGLGSNATLQTLTGTGSSAQKGKLTVAALTNSAGGIIKIGG